MQLFLNESDPPLNPQVPFFCPSSPICSIAFSIGSSFTLSPTGGALTAFFSTPVIDGLAESFEVVSVLEVVGEIGSIANLR